MVTLGLGDGRLNPRFQSLGKAHREVWGEKPCGMSFPVEAEKKREAKQRAKEEKEREVRKREKAEEKERRRKEYDALKASKREPEKKPKKETNQASSKRSLGCKAPTGAVGRRTGVFRRG